MRDLDQNARAVACFRIASARSAMRKIDQDFDTLADDLVRPFAIKVYNESHPAGIVFVLRVVESLCLRRKRHASEYSFLQYHVNKNCAPVSISSSNFIFRRKFLKLKCSQRYP